MKTRNTLALATLISLGMLATTGCTADDDLRRPHTGTQLLQLGEVTVQGAQTARTATTRAITTEDIKTGFIGIRKTKFVETDELNLTLTAPNGSGGTTDTPVTATLGANGWTLTDRTYYTPGTTLTATYTPATQQDGSNPGGLKYADELTATVGNLPVNGSKLSLTLTHANALVEVTPPAGITYTDLTVTAIPDGSGAPTPAAQELGTSKEEDAGSIIRHRTIARAGSALQSISLKVNGMTYTTSLTQKVEANKRYPITLSITKDKLVATVGASDLNWGAPEGFDGRPGGYTHYIYTADDLAQFAADVNAGIATTATALQMADIDLANREWTPIGSASVYFSGKYNGNGHTISNLTISNGPTYSGLFGGIDQSHITGVHLRNCSIVTTAVSARAGALVGYAHLSSIITLCSATGSVEASGSNPFAGGLIGRAYGLNAPCHITRCSADVAVTMTSTNAGYVGGLVGYTDVAYYAGCIASGKVHKKKNGNGTTLGTSSGFSNTPGISTDNYNAFGCITNCEIVNDDAGATSAFGTITMVRSCIATKSYGNFYANTAAAIGNVCLGALGTSQSGVTPNANPASAHTNLINATNLSYYKMKTLHYSKEEGYTLKLVEGYHFYAKDLWKDNGTALPTLNMSYEGSPTAISANNRVYTVNGYYVTAPEVNENTTYAWQAAKDLCDAAADKGWRLPSMKDYEAILGWTGTHPWIGVATIQPYLPTDREAFKEAFTSNLTSDIISTGYWASDDLASNTANAWDIITKKANQETEYYYEPKTNRNRVRCVQEQKTTP